MISRISGFLETGPGWAGKAPEPPDDRHSGGAGRLETTHPPFRKTLAMNTIARWNPLRELEEFQTRILNAFRTPPPQGQGHKGTEGFTQSAWLPPVDIAEDDKEYVITADLPEVGPKDVKVTLENGILSITGERTGEKEETARKYHVIERSCGAFARSFALPSDGDSTKVQAHFKDGVLTVRVPKSEAARPKLIEVKTS